jgi:Cu/Ag efflux pump CusA
MASRVRLPGMAAEEVEQRITIPLERELNGTPARSRRAIGQAPVAMALS